MHEIYRKLNANDVYKWSRIGQENAFLLATNLGKEVIIDYDCDVTNINSLRMENALNIMKDSSMENCLDPLILVVRLPSVSVTNTSD